MRFPPRVACARSATTSSHKEIPALLLLLEAPGALVGPRRKSCLSASCLGTAGSLALEAGKVPRVGNGCDRDFVPALTKIDMFSGGVGQLGNVEDVMAKVPH